MSFIIFMTCICAAIFSGIIIEKIRHPRKSYNPNNKEYKCYYIGLKTRSRLEIENIIIPRLKNVFEVQNNVLRVYDLYLLFNISYRDDRDFIYGWTDLEGFEVAWESKEGYYLKFPEPTLLEK